MIAAAQRQAERAMQVEARAVALVARRDDLRADGRELRLRARHVERDADPGVELVARDAEQVLGERRIGDARGELRVRAQHAHVHRGRRSRRLLRLRRRLVAVARTSSRARPSGARYADGS